MDKIMVTRSAMPDLKEYVDMIAPLWESRWLTNMGKLHNELEERLKEYLGVPGISLMSNGHMALELSLAAMEFQKGSEVITTPFTFISTTHAIIRSGLKPVFCDIKMSDYTIDEEKIEGLITEKTVAILPVHVYGNLCAVEKIQELADKYHLKVIYDAAHAFGETYQGKGIGSYGDASVFSFHATKVFHTIEGGAVCFHEPSLKEKLYNLKNFGIRSEEIVESVGANAKMNEFVAAMGICNLRHIDEEIEKRQEIVRHYLDFFQNVPGIKVLYDSSSFKRNYAYFPIFIDETIYGRTRDEMYDQLKEADIYSRKYFYPLTSDQDCFRGKYAKIPLDNARYISKRILTLPLHGELGQEEMERILKCWKK